MENRSGGGGGEGNTNFLKSERGGLKSIKNVCRGHPHCPHLGAFMFIKSIFCFIGLITFLTS